MSKLAVVSVCFVCSMSGATTIVEKSCSDWNISRKANLSTVVQREWVYGYLSGLRDMLKLKTGQEFTALLPANEVIVSQLNQYCESHPQDSVNKAAIELFNRALSE